MNANTFKAPWGKTLCWMSAFSVVVILAVTVPLFATLKSEAGRWPVAIVVLMLPVAALFAVRSYAIEPNVLAIQRLLWTTRLPLSGLQSAEAVPGVMRGSLRLFGNGGMFSITACIATARSVTTAPSSPTRPKPSCCVFQNGRWLSRRKIRSNLSRKFPSSLFARPDYHLRQ